jgi:hypothetical protein
MGHPPIVIPQARAVVATNGLRPTATSYDARKGLDDIVRAESSSNFQGKALAGKDIDHGEQPNRVSIFRC